MIDEWDTHNFDGPDWAYDGRIKLNGVIRSFNAWQMLFNFDEELKVRLIGYIESGINTWANEDGGSYWLEELQEMRKFIAEREVTDE